MGVSKTIVALAVVLALVVVGVAGYSLKGGSGNSTATTSLFSAAVDVQTSSAAASAATVSSASTLCNPQLPISLASSRIGTYEYYGEAFPAIYVTLSNCASQSYEVELSTGNLSITVANNGNATDITGIADSLSAFAISAEGAVTTPVIMDLNSAISSGATIESASCSMTVLDSTTNQALSINITFVAQGGG